MDFNAVSENISLPTYDRTLLQKKIVHIGVGAFHRGHQAYVLDQLHRMEENEWGICGVTLFGSSDAMINQLKDQQCLYTVVERFNDESRGTIVGSVIDVLQRSKVGSQVVIDQLAEPQVAIVTLTITEKGYCMLVDGKHLDMNNPNIVHDLEHRDDCTSVPAILYAALKKRYDLNLSPLTLISCDNIPENSRVLKHAIIEFAKIVDPTFVEYIEKNVAFPCSMVDRIVPAATAETLRLIEEEVGTEDLCGIETEPFLQWVIEDQFAGERPNFEKVNGVSVVKNVVPFEEMKLRMLNGSHSFLAYLGTLAGHQYIADCMADETFKSAVLQLMMQEQAVTLSVDGIDLNGYANQLIERFENRALKHQTLQIAMDGSQKIPQRFLASKVWHQRRGNDTELIDLGIAGWIYFIHQNSHNLKDPYQEKIHQFAESSASVNDFIQQIVQLDIFPEALQTDTAFIAKMNKLYHLIAEQGATQAIQTVLKG